jgi:hypothetical protein
VVARNIVLYKMRGEVDGRRQRHGLAGTDARAGGLAGQFGKIGLSGEACHDESHLLRGASELRVQVKKWMSEKAWKLPPSFAGLQFPA